MKMEVIKIAMLCFFLSAVFVVTEYFTNREVFVFPVPPVPPLVDTSYCNGDKIVHLNNGEYWYRLYRYTNGIEGPPHMRPEVME